MFPGDTTQVDNYTLVGKDSVPLYISTCWMKK